MTSVIKASPIEVVNLTFVNGASNRLTRCYAINNVVHLFINAFRGDQIVLAEAEFIEAPIEYAPSQIVNANGLTNARNLILFVVKNNVRIAVSGAQDTILTGEITWIIGR